MRGVFYPRDGSGYLTVGSEYLNRQIRSITQIGNNFSGKPQSKVHLFLLAGQVTVNA